MEAIIPWLVVGAGLFSVAGAVLDWDWFMNSRRAWLIVKLFGRGGARVFYGLLGAVLAVMGFALAFAPAPAAAV
jgi:hypothetical protein